MNMEWQPIETAPISTPLKPEHRVMLWVVRAGIAFGYVYDDGCGGVMPSPDGYCGNWEVTHWMPLPEPPK